MTKGIEFVNVRAGFCVVMLILGGCVASPNIINFDVDGENIAAFQCMNVSRKQEELHLDEKFYRTTYGSVYDEVYQSSTFIKTPIIAGSTVLSEMPPKKTFCLVYPYDFKIVSRAVALNLRSLGIKISISNIKSGEYETEYIYKVHQDVPEMLRNFSARWKESYRVFVSENIEGGTDVRIYRDISISRIDNTKNNEFTPYLHATSDGNNEAWFLLQVDNYLRTARP